MEQTKMIKILSIRIDCLTFSQVYQRLTDLVNGQKTRTVTTPNPEIILLARRDDVLRKIINTSDLNIPDGTGLIWAAKFNSLPLTSLPILRPVQAFIQFFYTLFLYLINPNYGHDIIPGRITGVDIVPEIAKICAENRKTIFFLGAGPGVAAEAARRLQAVNPSLKIAGVHPGHWPAEFDEENLAIINHVRPDCLVLAFGAPREQWWISRNTGRLPSVKLVIGVGGGLDFISGSASVLGGKSAVRAPQWIQRLKLEWLHRLIHQPDRWRRILNAVIIFPFYVYLNKISHQNNR